MDRAGNLEEMGHIVFGRADQHPMSEIHDVPRPLGFPHGVNNALLNGGLGAKQYAWVHIALQQQDS